MKRDRAICRARMQVKEPRFYSESVQLFGIESSHERLGTKNVHQASVLRLGWCDAIENRRGEIT
jgi:hypothetical protein